MSDIEKYRLSLWASGSGTNVENIIKYFKDNQSIEVSHIIVSHKDAKVIQRAISFDVPYHVISKTQLNDPNYIIPLLHNYKTDYLILAGFIWKIPSFLIDTYPDKILNIHPALLPDFGGKGMYGSKVHESVKESGRKESGITIHYVNEKYDDGDIIFQEKCDIEGSDSPSDIQEKVQELEYKYYPKVIESVINKE